MCYAARPEPLACQHWSNYKSANGNKPTTKGAYGDQCVSINQSMSTHKIWEHCFKQNQLYLIRRVLRPNLTAASMLTLMFCSNYQRGMSTRASAGLPCLRLILQLDALPKACALAAALLQRDFRHCHFLLALRRHDERIVHVLLSAAGCCRCCRCACVRRRDRAAAAPAAVPCGTKLPVRSRQLPMCRT